MTIGSRRRFVATLTGAAAAVLTASRAAPAGADSRGSLQTLTNHILARFATLPGEHALYIVSPAVRGPDLEVSLNADTALFCGSAFKAFVLGEYMHRIDAGKASLDELLTLDSDVWSISSPVLTPYPGTVTGRVNARTVLDAMISRSDNTATDMAMNRLGVDRIREFIASIGLSSARIPDNTRKFFGYVFGDPKWQTISFEQLVQFLDNDPFVPNPVLNDVQTMAVSPRDFVSFYSRALQGEFFRKAGTTTTFRAILSQSEAIPRAVPLGMNAFIKGGSIDFNGQHALCIAGGAFMPADRWAYFGMTINWTDAQGGTVEEEGPQFGMVANDIFASMNERLGSC
jgi:beta-lactamase class A